MEVLAPAGSMEALMAAMAGGADAVYLGGRSFGARMFADNFDNDELASAVATAHDRSVKVYVAVNTLIKTDELDDVASYIATLDSMDVDGVIIQDRGVIDMVRETSMRAHASTQMGIHSLEGVEWASEAGLDRVILARELSLEEIGHISGGSDMPLEVFIHGALCLSFSGQCLFSSMLGGRSGNRGMCAQPCRKPYTMGSRSGHILSTADLLGVDSVDALHRMGVASIKIEGRMRSPDYVYAATRLYSKAANDAMTGESTVTERDVELVEVAFNREFTPGHLGGSTTLLGNRKEHMGMPLGTMGFIGGRSNSIHPSIRPGDGVTLRKDGVKRGGFTFRGNSLKANFDLEDGEYEVWKTYDRRFSDIRKDVARAHPRKGRWQAKERHVRLPSIDRRPRRPDLSFYVSSIRTLEAVSGYADRVYFELNRHIDEARELCQDHGIEMVTLLPRISPTMPDVDEAVMVSTHGQLHHFNDRVYGSSSLNVLNPSSMPPVWQQTLSLECSRKDVEAISRHHPGRLEVMVFGRTEMMVIREDLGEGTLIDRRRMRFPVNVDRDGCTHIMNSRDLFLLENIGDLGRMGIDSVGIDLRRRRADLAELVGKACVALDMPLKRGIERMCGGITTGRFKDGVR